MSYVVVRPKILQKRPVGVSRDNWRIIKRRSMEEMGHKWKRDMLPNHFTSTAKGKYQHRPRSEKYIDNKKKLAARGKVQGGGVTDLVFSGRSRDALISNPGLIRAFPSRITLRMQGTTYFNMNYRAKTNQPNKPRELTTVTREEQRILARVARDKAVELIKAARENKTITP